MLKCIYVVQCDICGRTQPAKEIFARNETCYVIPDDWIKSDTNSDFLICPKCLLKLSKE